jgi:hypothetical protein
MRLIKSALVVSSLMAGAALGMARSATALPLSPATGGTALTAQLGQALPTIQVRRRGGGIAAGIIGGAIIGGIIASQRPYNYDYPPPYYYGYYPGYYPYYPAYRPYYPAYRPYYPAYRPYGYVPSIDYCMRRFKSYDPVSMTYLGYDGICHPCP